MFFRLSVLVIFFVILGMSAFAKGSSASEPKLIGTYGAWQAFTLKDNGQPVCYMVAKVHVAPNKKFKRGNAWLTITHRPAENSKDVISYTAGYNYQASSDAAVHIGKEDFDLFTEKDTAWSRDTKTDHALASSIRKSVSLSVTGTPSAKNAKPIKDVLDIKGADTAYQAIGKACGLEASAQPKPQAKKPVAQPKKKDCKISMF